MTSTLSGSRGQEATKKARGTRQITLDSAFSRLISRTASSMRRETESTTPSFTNSCSTIDEASEAPDGSQISDKFSEADPLIVSTDNDKDVTSSLLEPVKQRAVSSFTTTSSRAVSGETLVDYAVEFENESTKKLLEESVEALDQDWEIGHLPGDNLQKITIGESKDFDSMTGSQGTGGIQSAAIKVVDRILGKRSRPSEDGDTNPSKKAKRHSLAALGASAHRPKRNRRSISTANLAITTPAVPTSTRSKKKCKKMWLNQGLWLGQERSFDPRFSTSSNEKKKAQSLTTIEEKENTTMPMPMFFGETRLKQGEDFRLPWDVYSPAPRDGARPEWKKTQKNVFIGDAEAYWRTYTRPEQSMCMCSESSGCDEDCLNRTMLYECDNSNCNLGAKHCTNRSFAELRNRYKKKEANAYDVGVDVVRTAGRGFGLRANRTFEPNQIIVEYTGEIITQHECDHRMRTAYKDAECYYLMDFDQGTILDATRGSVARFANHSCLPNCNMIKWTVSGKPRMALFAGGQGIMASEELTYDYNFAPSSMNSVQECKCGADTCRGVLGPRPKEVRDAVKSVSLMQKRQEGGDGDGKRPKKFNKPLPKGWIYHPTTLHDSTPKSILPDDPEALLRTKTRRKSHAASTTLRCEDENEMQTAEFGALPSTTNPLVKSSTTSTARSRARHVVQSLRDSGRTILPNSVRGH